MGGGIGSLGLTNKWIWRVHLIPIFLCLSDDRPNWIMWSYCNSSVLSSALCGELGMLWLVLEHRREYLCCVHKCSFGQQTRHRSRWWETTDTLLIEDLCWISTTSQLLPKSEHTVSHLHVFRKRIHLAGEEWELNPELPDSWALHLTAAFCFLKGWVVCLDSSSKHFALPQFEAGNRPRQQGWVTCASSQHLCNFIVCLSFVHIPAPSFSVGISSRSSYEHKDQNRIKTKRPTWPSRVQFSPLKGFPLHSLLSSASGHGPPFVLLPHSILHPAQCRPVVEGVVDLAHIISRTECYVQCDKADIWGDHVYWGVNSLFGS